MKKTVLFAFLLSAFSSSLTLAQGTGLREVVRKHVINANLNGTNLPFAVNQINDNPRLPSLLNSKNPSIRFTDVMTNDDGTINVPFLYSPTADDFELFTVIDNNNDGKTWVYDKKKKALRYRYSVSEQADDYVILPAIKITDVNYMYTFSIDAAPSNDTYGESFELCVAKSNDVASMQSILQSGMIYGTEYSHYTGYFAADEPGTYYVAVKATSPKNGWRLYVQNLAVNQTNMKPTVPNVPTELTVTPAPLGETAANLTFTMPLIDAANNPLPSDKKITMKVNSSVETINVEGLPGSVQNVKIKTEQGDNILNFVAVNEDGDGIAVTRSIFTGMDIPSVPELTSSVSEDNMTMHLSWETSIVGKNGGYVNPENVDYMIRTYNEINGEGFWEEYKSIGNATEFDYTLPENSEQQVLSLGVTVSNDMGENKHVTSISEVVGTPYKLPIMEYYNGKKMNYKPVVIEETEEFSDATWGFMDPTDVIADAKNESCAAMVGYITDYGKSVGKLSLPKFSTYGINDVKIDFNVYFHPLMPLTEIHAAALGTDEVLVGTMDSSMAEGWHKVTFNLPKEFSNKKWVTLYVTANYPGENEEEYIIIDQYVVREVLNKDLAVTQLIGVKKAEIGDNINFTATVENFGLETAKFNDSEFNIIVEGNKVFSKKVTDSESAVELKSGESRTLDIPVIINADMLGEAEFIFSISHDDENTANNQMKNMIVVNKGNLPVVTDLSAERSTDGEGVDLNWTAIGKLAGVEDCEKLNEFSYSKKLGEFKNIDVDGKNTFVMNGTYLPGQGYPKAFQVFNYEMSGLESETYKPHSGNQCLMAMCPDDEVSAADDWLISPIVMGGSEMSFYMDILSSKYVPETFEIMVSSTTDDIESFTNLEKAEKSTVGWEKFTFTLPEDAKYFAIRYTSTNCFGIMIDDIDFIPEAGVPVVKYNIYRNNVIIAEDVEDPFYCDNIVEGIVNYNVTAKVDGVEQPMSNTATIENIGTGINNVEDAECQGVVACSNGIEIIGMNGENVTIYTFDGTMVSSLKAVSSRFFVSLKNGLYIVKTANSVYKVNVR